MHPVPPGSAVATDQGALEFYGRNPSLLLSMYIHGAQKMAVLEDLTERACEGDYALAIVLHPSFSIVCQDAWEVCAKETRSDITRAVAYNRLFFKLALVSESAAVLAQNKLFLLAMKAVVDKRPAFLGVFANLFSMHPKACVEYYFCLELAGSCVATLSVGNDSPWVQFQAVRLLSLMMCPKTYFENHPDYHRSLVCNMARLLMVTHALRRALEMSADEGVHAFIAKCLYNIVWTTKGLQALEYAATVPFEDVVSLIGAMLSVKQLVSVCRSYCVGTLFNLAVNKDAHETLRAYFATQLFVDFKKSLC